MVPQSKRRLSLRWPIALTALVAFASLMEPDLRATVKSNLAYAVRGYQRGFFSQADGFATYPHLLYTHFRLGLQRSLAKYLPSRRLQETGLLGLRVRAYDLHAIEFGFGYLFLSKPYWFKSTRPAPLIIDCGSNIGLSVLYFKKLYPEAEIIAFEPSKRAFDLLQRNVESNHLAGVTLYRAALSDKKGRLRLYSDESASLTASIFSKRSSRHAETVQAVRLSDFIDRRVDLLKVDVEGAERLIFKDLNDSGKLHFVREMVVEYHHHIDTGVDRMSELLDILERNHFGYQMTTSFRYPFKKKQFQDIMIYGYQE